MTTARRALLCAFAALLAVSAPTLRAAADSAASRGKLSSELPAGVTLSKASIDQTAAAVKSAVAKDKADATSILTSAIMAKTPKQGQGKLSCADVAKLTRAAIAGAPRNASQIVQTAESLDPDCADTLDRLSSEPVAAVSDVDNPALNEPTEEYGFGVGFGTGFPGSPGFVGSAPSGAIALPTPVPVVTSTTNS